MKKLVLGVTFIAAVALFSACSTKKEAETAGAVKTSAASPPMHTDTSAAESAAVPSGENIVPADTENGEEPYRKITAEEAKKMIDEGGVTVVDVRREGEYKAGHIPGSILVPNETIEEEAAEALPDKDAVLLVHCRTGIRSKQASDKLVKLGYKHIYDFGGIVDWPYETVTGE